MRKFQIKNGFDMEPINHRMEEEAFFVDLSLREIVLLAETTEESDSLIRLPYQEDLYPYGRAMADYLIENGLSVPRGIRAGEFLRNEGRWEDFSYGFWPGRISESFSKWLEEENLELESYA